MKPAVFFVKWNGMIGILEEMKPISWISLDLDAFFKTTKCDYETFSAADFFFLILDNSEQNSLQSISNSVFLVSCQSE